MKYVQREYRKLSHFLVSVDQKDFNPPFSRSFEDVDLNRAFQRLSEIIVSLRDEAQINYQYLQTIINHINTAVICMDASQRIVLANGTANKLFNKSVLRDINSLRIKNDDLPGILRDLKTGEKKLVKLNLNEKICNYSIQLAEFKLKNEWFRLFSFQNVQSELEQNELESWQKLTRVITHEIMNSAIPVSNLSGIVYKQLFKNDDTFNGDLSEEDQSDIKEGLKTIENRSKGLVNFVEATRNFTKMPNPELEQIYVHEVLNRIVVLLNPKIEEFNIELKVNIESKDLKILADQSMVEHALINLILNAVDALHESKNPGIILKAMKDHENHVVISIEDNGKGISENELENIFIPFYTTKRNGSGIGLSLTKQIMFLHKGNISVKSEVNLGTTFLLTF